MSTHLKSMVNAIINQDSDLAGDHFRIHIQESIFRLLSEDHQLYMSEDQMVKHLNKLHGLANDKEAFLKSLANFSSLEKCTEKDFQACSKSIVAKGKTDADRAIHSLEKLVGYEYNPQDLKENIGNVVTKALRGATGKKIPNVLTNKDVNDLDKKPLRLKKGKYGTGNPPSLSVGVGGGDAGAGGGGGE
ncbi:hypothetical protein [Stenotrophomonas phage RAS14]